ncbi:MAG: carbamate kinase [Firmicutes bacterium]|nr:carbamate kinase [Bacillota bacterium]
MGNELVVIALGGNAILQPGQRGTAEEQLENVRATCRQVVTLLEEGYRIVLTHGNGPQVGNIIIQNQATDAVPAMPMDICGAESQGLIGYMMQHSLHNELVRRGMDGWPVASVVTQTVVSADDPAFRKPTKPVGPFYDEEYARRKIEAGETWVEDAGRGWRKVVPSPDPVEIVELEVIRQLARDHAIVICTGGGGIPVVREPDGSLRGVEAVIDKDLGGQRLATGLGADLFMILTDVARVALDYGKPTQRFLSRLTVAEARALQKEGHFRPGSMGPKVEACCRFVEAGGKGAIIGSLMEALDALAGRAGTWIVPA